MDKTADSSQAEVREDQEINHILSSLSNLIKKRKFQDALESCDRALDDHPNHEKLLEKKIKILCHQGLFDDAYNLALQWLQREPRHPVAIKELKRLKIVIEALKDQDTDEEAPVSPIHQPETEPQPQSPPQPVPVSHISYQPPPQPPREHVVRTLHTPSKVIPRPQSREVPIVQLSCSFCSMTFDSQNDLELHCKSDEHKKNITSDEGHNWKYRPPPRGSVAEEYLLCQRFTENGRCPFADKCTHAHSLEELEEWKERFIFKRQQLQLAKEKHLHGNTYPEQLMEKLMTTEYPKSVMVANVDYAKVIVNSDLKISMATKKCTNAWTFTVTSKICILRVVLLDEAGANYFHISSISVGPKKTQKYQNLETCCQEWKNPDITINRPGEYVYRVKVVFKTDIYGTFRQTLVFDFGSEPVLSREIVVESAPVTDTEKITSEFRLSGQRRWRADIVQVVPFKPKPSPEDEMSESLLAKYSLPAIEKFRFSEHLMHLPSKENYRLWMHQMLYVEEFAQIDKISKYNVTTSLQLVNRFLLVPGALSNAKFAQDGELFARMKLEDDLSVDSVAGRLILQNCSLVWLAPHKESKKHHTPSKVYEAMIEDRGKNFIFLRLSSEVVEELKLTCDQEFPVEVQFQLNRLHLCEMHNAVDSLRTLDLVFPDLYNIPEFPSLSDWQWKEEIEERLNEKQKEAIIRVASLPNTALPPVLIVGPFGTGKTYTVAQATKQVLEEPNSRILICTQSNSAADLYIKDYLHPYVMEGNLDARPLRILYRHRWIQTVPETVLQYCIQEMTGPLAGSFRAPTKEDVQKHRVVITTLSTARLLSDLDLPVGFFTHIFLDEAAQALECEMLIPLSLVGPNTRVILAGDHMQMSPEVFSDFGRQQQFHKSMLERLYDLYPDDCPCKVMLCENYRSNRAIIEFTSELFYDHKLKASKDPVAHSVYYPLTFFTARGEEVQHENSSGYYNTAEIYEVIEQVDHLHKHWPLEWGEFDDNSVCIVSPYSDQVIQIRAELRKRKMSKVSVERVVNVQGKQFRVIMLSTVRTRHTCTNDAASEKLDLGFLSNIKLLNTAVTRAESLVVVVGDPVSLCLVGKCSKVWEYYLEVCNDHNSFFGMTWPHLKSLLNNVEMTKTYILNPLAPEFIPKSIFPQGQPVFMAPGHPQSAPGLYHPRSMSPGHGYPQMYHPAYMPMVYQGYHPYYGPLFYRPHPNMFQGGALKGMHRGPIPGHKVRMPPHAHHQAGDHVPMQRVEKAGTQSGKKAATQRGEQVPVQRSESDERSASESPHSESGHPSRCQGNEHASVPAPGAAAGPVPIPVHGHVTGATSGYPSGSPASGTPPGRKVHQKARMVYMPRAVPYQPYFAYPHYVIPPDDPRYMGMPLNMQPPYFYNYPGYPLRHPYMGGPLPFQVPTRPTGSGSLSPASSTEGSVVRPIASLEISPTESSHSDNRSYSPALSPGSSVTGIQVLPNVKHVPSHLFTTAGSGPNSRSSTPVGLSSSPLTVTHQKKEESVRQSMADQTSESFPSAEKEFPAFRKRQHSGPRPVSQSPSYSSQSSHENSMSPTHDVEPGIKTDTQFRLEMASQTVEKTSTLQTRGPKNLKLNTTGFSRQFSDDLGTPTEVTKIVKMIEENIDEGDEDAFVRQADKLFREESQMMKPSPPSGKLYLNLKAPQQAEDSVSQSSSSSSIDDEFRRSYAGGVMQTLPSYKDQELPLLEPQTPMTPAGFITPGADINTDPLELLRNLNINNDNLNRSAHGHFC